MWKQCWLLACGVALGLVLASPAGLAAQPEGRPMLGLPTQGLRAKEVPPDKLVFTRQSDWTEFWAKYGTGAPLLDFSVAGGGVSLANGSRAMALTSRATPPPARPPSAVHGVETGPGMIYAR
jgi:hypothetical protein